METAVKPTRRVFEMPPADGSIRFERTPRDAGAQCELKLTRNDNGMWHLNGRPIADGAPDVLTVLAFGVTAWSGRGSRETRGPRQTSCCTRRTASESRS